MIFNAAVLILLSELISALKLPTKLWFEQFKVIRFRKNENKKIVPVSLYPSFKTFDILFR